MALRPHPHPHPPLGPRVFDPSSHTYPPGLLCLTSPSNYPLAPADAILHVFRVHSWQSLGNEHVAATQAPAEAGCVELKKPLQTSLPFMII